MRVRRVTSGPLFPAEGPRGARLQRRAKGIAIEAGGFVLLTLALPLVLPLAALVDLALWLVRRKPWMAVRLACMAWWFLFGELRGIAGLAAIYLITGGPAGPRLAAGAGASSTTCASTGRAATWRAYACCSG